MAMVNPTFNGCSLIPCGLAEACVHEYPGGPYDCNWSEWGKMASCKTTTPRCVWKQGYIRRGPVHVGQHSPTSTEELKSLPDSQDDEGEFVESFTIEDGTFEETFPSIRDAITEEKGPDDRFSLIPEEWRLLQEELQEELTMTKEEQKREARNALEVRAERIENQRRLNLLKRDAGHEAYRRRFFPRVLLWEDESKNDKEQEDEWGGNPAKNTYDSNMDAMEVRHPVRLQRAIPRNPRLALGDATFEDVARWFQDDCEDSEEKPSCLGGNGKEVKELSVPQLLSAEEKAMLESPDVNLARISSENWTPLHTLAASGQINLVNQLLRLGADVNAIDMDGMTALHWAVLHGRESMANHLLKAGANVQATDMAGATALHYAVQTANGTLIKLLIQHRINVNSCDNDGWTPLHVAVQSGRSDIVKLLLECGAAITLANKDGNTPVDMAVSYSLGFGFSNIYDLLKTRS